jgi:hypothetical protein
MVLMKVLHPRDHGFEMQNAYFRDEIKPFFIEKWGD